MITEFEKAVKWVNGKALCWLRRDLRLQDNAALYHALKENDDVCVVFIFDTVILDNLCETKDARVEFIHLGLGDVQRELERMGSSLLVLHGNPVELYSRLSPRCVYVNIDYEPYARRRDEAIERDFGSRNISFHQYKDQVIFDRDEVVKDDGNPYTVFTPYSKRWKSKVNDFYVSSYPLKISRNRFAQIPAMPIPSLNDIGFEPTGLRFPERKIKQSIIEGYDKTRNFPGIDGTSRLSVHLRFGTVSIRKLVQVALKKKETWLNELIWREFYMMILWHFPSVEEKSFKPAYDRIEWRNDPDEFDAWCNGKTGYPIVDAGMRELNETGYMHNRVRMITASFLTKHLLVDWRWGEAYFARKLLDYDLAANNGGWQWSSGSGCDAAPYFRIFNPELQARKFDPRGTYVRRWVPEADSDNYVRPIVDHSRARERVLSAYATALETDKKKVYR